MAKERQTQETFVFLKSGCGFGVGMGCRCFVAIPMAKMVVSAFRETRRERFAHFLAELFMRYALEKDVGVEMITNAKNGLCADVESLCVRLP